MQVMQTLDTPPKFEPNKAFFDKNHLTSTHARYANSEHSNLL